MKFLTILISSFIFAVTAMAQSNAACEQQAKDAIVGLVMGLGQDVTVEKVTLVKASAKNESATETYQIKLKGKGFISQETNNIWEVKLNDLGDGCNFSSVKLLTQNKSSISSKEQVVELSSDSDLEKLMKTINSVNNGSSSGKATDPAQIQCVMTKSDRYCTISELQNQ